MSQTLSTPFGKLLQNPTKESKNWNPLTAQACIRGLVKKTHFCEISIIF